MVRQPVMQPENRQRNRTQTSEEPSATALCSSGKLARAAGLALPVPDLTTEACQFALAGR